jgi:hypothetical protein
MPPWKSRKDSSSGGQYHGPSCDANCGVVCLCDPPFPVKPEEMTREALGELCMAYSPTMCNDCPYNEGGSPRCQCV